MRLEVQLPNVEECSRRAHKVIKLMWGFFLRVIQSCLFSLLQSHYEYRLQLSSEKSVGGETDVSVSVVYNIQEDKQFEYIRIYSG